MWGAELIIMTLKKISERCPKPAFLSGFLTRIRSNESVHLLLALSWAGMR